MYGTVHTQFFERKKAVHNSVSDNSRARSLIAKTYLLACCDFKHEMKGSNVTRCLVDNKNSFWLNLIRVFRT